MHIIFDVDHGKLGRVFLMRVVCVVRVADLDVAHEVITDAGLPDEARQALEARGLRAHIAGIAEGAPAGEEVHMAG